MGRFRCVPLALIAGCVSTGSDYEQMPAHGHTASTISGNSGAAATSSGSGTTTGGSSSGSTGTTGGCQPPGITNCPAGLDEISISLEDICTQEPVTIPIQATAYGATETSTSLPCGGIYFCVDGGTQLTMEISNAPGYASTILETLNVQYSRTYTDLPLVCSTFFSSIPPGTASGSIVVIAVGPVLGNPACADLSGWSFALTDLDGGPVSSSAIYLSGELPDPAATATTQSGIAILYDIQGGVNDVLVEGSSSTSTCQAANDEEQWTNLVHLEPLVASIAPFLIDTDGGIADSGM